MKELKLYIISATFLFCGYLYLDFKTYYYGLSYGIFNKKLSDRLEIIFAGSDLGNQGIILKERDMNLHIVRANDSIFFEGEEEPILVKKIVGYWITDKNLQINIKDKNNKNRYFEISVILIKNLYPDYIFREIKIIPNKSKYVDLDKSLKYFKTIKLIKNLFFILFLFISILLSRKFYLLKKK